MHPDDLDIDCIRCFSVSFQNRHARQTARVIVGIVLVKISKLMRNRYQLAEE